MNRLKYLFLHVLVLISYFAVNSCSSDDSDISSIELDGTWTGIYTYYNPASGYKFQYLYITFNSDGSGSLEYQSPVSFAAASFMYQISDNIIECHGAYASTNDDSPSIVDLTLIYLDGKLYPQDDQFSKFILSREGTTTSGDGDEVVEDNDMLMYCWRSIDGYKVLDFGANSMTEFIMTNASSRFFSRESTHDYKYDPVRKLLTIYDNDMVEFTVKTLNETSLVIYNTSTKETSKFTKIGVMRKSPWQGYLKNHRAAIQNPIIGCIFAHGK